MDYMKEALDILSWGLLKVFAVLATIFVGVKFIHWFVPADEKVRVVAKEPRAVQERRQPAVEDRPPPALTSEEMEAVRIALYNATGGSGTLGRILEVTQK